MKKINILIGTIISIIITFVFAELFSLYHFGDVPTLLTLFYLISIFSIFEYVLLGLVYILKKILNKEKIKGNEIVGRILLFIALILILGFCVILDIDWLHRYMYSSPFYIYVTVRSIEFLVPAIILIIIGRFLIRKSK